MSRYEFTLRNTIGDVGVHKSHIFGHKMRYVYNLLGLTSTLCCRYCTFR